MGGYVMREVGGGMVVMGEVRGGMVVMREVGGRWGGGSQLMCTPVSLLHVPGSW